MDNRAPDAEISSSCACITVSRPSWSVDRIDSEALSGSRGSRLRSALLYGMPLNIYRRPDGLSTTIPALAARVGERYAQWRGTHTQLIASVAVRRRRVDGRGAAGLPGLDQADAAECNHHIGDAGVCRPIPTAFR